MTSNMNPIASTTIDRFDHLRATNPHEVAAYRAWHHLWSGTRASIDSLFQNYNATRDPIQHPVLKACRQHAIHEVSTFMVEIRAGIECWSDRLHASRTTTGKLDYTASTAAIHLWDEA